MLSVVAKPVSIGVLSPLYASLTVYQPIKRQGFACFVLKDKHNEPSPWQQRHRQWPYRGLAFASDLGIVGHFIQQPKLAWGGWLIAMPYYLYSLWIQPSKERRQEELLYQSTANLAFPLAEAKLGTAGGAMLGKKLLNAGLKRMPVTMWKFLGGIAALVAMTPTIGDPISERIVHYFNARKS